MIACLTLTGAIVVPVIAVLFTAGVIALRWREGMREARYERDLARDATKLVLNAYVAANAIWTWPERWWPPERLADKGSANPVAESSNDCYSSSMEMAKEG